MAALALTAAERQLLRRAAWAVLADRAAREDDRAGAERALAALSPGRPDASAHLGATAADRAFLRELSTESGCIESLAAAVAGKRRIQFRYRSGETAADQTRRVDPFGLGYRNGCWYLAGVDADRRDTRVFRVARMAGQVTARRSGRFAALEIDLEELLAASPFGFGPRPGPATSARVLVPADLAANVAAVLPESFTARRVDGGQLLVRLTIRDAGALFDWLFRMGPGVELLGPAELRAQLAVRLETTSIGWR